MSTRTHPFERIETWFFYGLGILLAVSAMIAFIQAVYLLVVNVLHDTSVIGIVVVLDRVLLVLMVVELLYTVRISTESREIQCQPFLIIGLIAAIRRVLVVTLQASMQASPTAAVAPASRHGILTESNLELLVLSLLIATIVGALVVLKRAGVP